MSDIENITVPDHQSELSTDAGISHLAALEPSTYRTSFRLYSTSDFLSQRGSAFLVRGFMYQSSLVLAYAPYETFKTFFALDLAFCIATGLPFHGREVVQAPVVIVCGEGGPHNQPRVEAWMKFHGFDSIPNFFICTEAPQIGSGDERLLLDRIDALKIKPGLIIIDPISTSNVNGKEAIDFSPFVAGMQRLRDHTGATVLATHHTGWRESHPRGHTSLPAAMDLMMTMERVSAPTRVQKSKPAAPGTGRASFVSEDMSDDTFATDTVLKISCTKNRIGKHFAPIFLSPAVVRLDRNDEYGDPITSCVLVDAEGPSSTSGLRATERVLLTTLKEQLDSQQSEWIAAGVWHEAMKTHDPKAWAVQKTFYRHRDSAIANGYVTSKTDRGPYALTAKGRAVLDRDNKGGAAT